MIITVLADKFNNSGSRYVMNRVEEPGILDKLNKIIEWDFCSWPKEVKSSNKNDTKELTDFLGTPPKLKPSNMFLFDGGQVIGIESPDILVLCVSETGPRALNRFVDRINWEADLLEIEDGVDVKIEEVEEDKIPNDYEKEIINYDLVKIIREKFLYGRYKESAALKIEITAPYFIFPVTVFLKGGNILSFSNLDIDDEDKDMINMVVHDVAACIYKKYDRINKLEDQLLNSNYSLHDSE